MGVEIMKSKGRFKNLFFVLDTCQASTMTTAVNTDGFFSICCSQLGESGYATNYSPELGTSLGDRFTDLLIKFLRAKRKEAEVERERRKQRGEIYPVYPQSSATIVDFFKTLNPDYL